MIYGKMIKCGLVAGLLGLANGARFSKNERMELKTYDDGTLVCTAFDKGDLVRIIDDENMWRVHEKGLGDYYTLEKLMKDGTQFPKGKREKIRKVDFNACKLHKDINVLLEEANEARRKAEKDAMKARREQAAARKEAREIRFENKSRRNSFSSASSGSSVSRPKATARNVITLDPAPKKPLTPKNGEAKIVYGQVIANRKGTVLYKPKNGQAKICYVQDRFRTKNGEPWCKLREYFEYPRRKEALPSITVPMTSQYIRILKKTRAVSPSEMTEEEKQNIKDNKEALQQARYTGKLYPGSAL